MAIIKPLLGELAGSVAGNTFSRNKGGLYVKRRSTPTNPNSELQQTARARFQTNSSYWSTALTQDQRDSWDQYAADNPRVNSLGEQKILTGHQMYVALNSILDQAGITNVLTPPTGPAPGALATYSATVTALTEEVEITFTPALPSNHKLYVFAVPNHAVGASPNQRQARFLGIGTGTSPATISTSGFAVPVANMKWSIFTAIVAPSGLISGYSAAVVAVS